MVCRRPLFLKSTEAAIQAIRFFSIRQSHRCRCLDEGAAGRAVYDKERVLVDPPKAVIFLKAASGYSAPV